jgi:hypothetical protein
MAEIITPKSIPIPAVEVKPKPRRIPFDGFAKKLEIHFPEGSTLTSEYHLHWFNDDGIRINKALQAGYEFVTRKDVEMNETVLPLNEDLGDRVSRVVGLRADGKPMHCFLMKLPLELRAQDEAKYAAEVAVSDEVIRRGATGQEGLAAKDQAARYIPQWGGIKYDPTNPEITKRRG